MHLNYGVVIPELLVNGPVNVVDIAVLKISPPFLFKQLAFA